MDEKVTVRWYTCNCEWVSKCCDDYHVAHALVPKSVLETYREPLSVSDYDEEEEGLGRWSSLKTLFLTGSEPYG